MSCVGSGKEFSFINCPEVICCLRSSHCAAYLWCLSSALDRTLYVFTDRQGTVNNELIHGWIRSVISEHETRILMAAHNGEHGGYFSSSRAVGWCEFCENQAITASEQFVRSFLDFQRSQFTSTDSAPRDPVMYARKFVEYFLQLFERQIKRTSYYLESQTQIKSTFQGNDPLFSGLSNEHHNLSRESSFASQTSRSPANGNSNSPFVDDYSDNVTTVNTSVTSPDVKSKHSPKEKGFLRRFSFRKHKRSVKHNSENTDLTGNHRKFKNNQRSKGDGKSSHVKSEIQGEVKRESVVNVLTGEDSKGKSRWEKTKLVLKETTGGSLLEFYSPPKVCENCKNIWKYNLFLAEKKNVWYKCLCDYWMGNKSLRNHWYNDTKITIIYSFRQRCSFLPHVCMLPCKPVHICTIQTPSNQLAKRKKTSCKFNAHYPQFAIWNN